MNCNRIDPCNTQSVGLQLERGDKNIVRRPRTVFLGRPENKMAKCVVSDILPSILLAGWVITTDKQFKHSFPMIISLSPEAL